MRERQREAIGSLRRQRAMESFGESLERLLGHDELARLKALPAPDDTDDAGDCDRCHGAGFLRRDVPAGHEDFGRLVECPCGIVTGRRAVRLWGEAQIPAEYAELEAEGYPDQVIIQDVRQWYEGQGRPWLLLDGPAGTGKTFLATWVTRLALGDGTAAIFRSLPELLAQIRDTYNPTREAVEPTELDLLEGLKAVGLLVLDDLGAEKPTGWVEEKLYDLLNHRHNHHKRTVITTNMDPDTLLDHVGERIFWRVRAMADRVPVEGRNLRLDA